MENQIKKYFSQENVSAKFKELLGKKAPGFITSVLQAVASNDLLSKATPESVFHATAIAATLDLPINPNLGFAFIIPYNIKKDGQSVTLAQFQVGWKGFVQLAQRTGQFKTIGAAPIYEGQLIESNPLTGFKFDFTQKKSNVIIGYAAYFSLINGFEKSYYMTADELKNHGVRFSQSFKKGYGLWKDDFDSMALKTVIKLLLSKFAPLSIEMQRAVVTDQALITDSSTDNVTYIDNEQPVIDKEAERIALMIEDAQSIDDLNKLREYISEGQTELFADKMELLTSKTKKNDSK